MDNIKYWLDHNFQNYLNKHGINSVSNDEIRLILLWLNSPAAKRHMKRIYKVSIPDAIMLSKKWNIQEKKKKENIKVIRKYHNNIQWVQLVSLDSIRQEGYKMDNCLKAYKEEDLKKYVYSLRDNGRSVVNVEFIDTLVSQVKGFKNFEVPAVYQEYILDFLIKNPIRHNYLSGSVLLDLGQIYVNHHHYDLKNLPNSLNIKESVTILNNNLITSIPDNWTIKGNLILENCPNLKFIGKNLHVSGYIRVKNCPQFEGFKDEELSVYSFEMLNLKNLIQLPKRLNSQLHIHIFNCDVLKELPETLYSAKDIVLYNLSQISEIKNIQANEIKIQNCKNLTNIVFCSTSTDLIIVNNENLHYLPNHLYIGKYLRSDRIINPKHQFKDYEHIFVGQGMVVKENDQWVKFDILDTRQTDDKPSHLMNLIKSFLLFLPLGNPKKVEVKE